MIDSHDQLNRIIIESIIYIDDFDIFLFTTLSPQTSVVYVSTTVKEGDSFFNKIIAKLVGHTSNISPTILYVP